jgi:hypothetical protein
MTGTRSLHALLLVSLGLTGCLEEQRVWDRAAAKLLGHMAVEAGEDRFLFVNDRKRCPEGAVWCGSEDLRDEDKTPAQRACETQKKRCRRSQDTRVAVKEALFRDFESMDPAEAHKLAICMVEARGLYAIRRCRINSPFAPDEKGPEPESASGEEGQATEATLSVPPDSPVPGTLESLVAPPSSAPPAATPDLSVISP